MGACCYGPGIQRTGVNVAEPTMFFIETFSDEEEDIEVFIENPNGQLEPVEIKFNEDERKIYTVTYHAKIEGLHTVKVKFGGKIHKHVFKVMVEGHAGDPSKVPATENNNDTVEHS